MKAACVLVCLALAHGITASIFKQQESQVDGLDVQQLKYIDQYQRQLLDQPFNEEQWNTRDLKLRNQKQREQSTQEQYRNEEVQKHRERSAKQQYRNQEVEKQQYQNQHALDKENEAQVFQYQQSYYPEQYPHSSEESNVPTVRVRRPVYLDLSHHHHHHEKPHHYQAYASSSSSSESQDSNERRYYDNQEFTHIEKQKWNPNTVVTKDIKINKAYGDTIMWKGLQMAVGPNAPVQTEEDIEKIFGDAQKAMKHITEEEKAKFHEVYELTKQEENEDAQLNATQLAQKYQYPVEEHVIKTDDGYVLTLFRIPPKQQIRDVQKRPVVFLMHDILGSADDWLLMGPGKSLAYLLSDAGYDVWLGNARGNKYSRQHVSKHPAMSDFWKFSTDEIALHDVSAMIDYALETTKQEKLYYIGHGQGTTVFFALTATRPEYNDKIIMMYALSPMVYMTNVRSPLFRMIAPTSKFQQRLLNQIGKADFTLSKDLIYTVGGAMCEKEVGCKKVCSHINFVMAGVNVDGLDSEVIPVVMKHLPAGTSTKVIKHYGQGVESHEFRRYDYGSQINNQVYGQEEPPKYNMAEVQAPVTLYYSEEDWLAHPKDVMRLQKELPNVKETYKVPEEHFSHMDFQFSKKAPEIVYQKLIESMQNQQL